MTHNIILIGMPGCGKSTIGTILARILPHYTLFDIDSIIEKTLNISEKAKETAIRNKVVGERSKSKK